MYNLIVKETKEEVIEHFYGLKVDGVGFELETPKVVWYKYQYDYSRQYLTFIAQEDGAFGFNGTDYYDDGETWTLLEVDGEIEVSSGDTVMWKGLGSVEQEEDPYDAWGIGTFWSDGNFIVEGSIMSLMYGDDFKGQTSLNNKYSMFADLFGECTGLTSAENLSLPATTLANYCYAGLFWDCSGLAVAPVLPATTLVEVCYDYMFQGCTSLTTAPELPATTLAVQCYNSMFSGCTSLTTAPELPATTLADECYYYMFQGCTSLTTAPELPATTLANSCYYAMFAGCTSLTNAPELPATTLAEGCYYDMFAGCTGLTTAPELPATTLAVDCYLWMFSGCTSLTNAPELPATTLAVQCYYGMFANCTSLNYVKCLASSGMTASLCLIDWLSGVASTGTFVKSPNATTGSTAGTSQWKINSADGIPTNWTVQDATF